MSPSIFGPLDSFWQIGPDTKVTANSRENATGQLQPTDQNVADNKERGGKIANQTDNENSFKEILLSI